jgi:predicted  nucleic acid-binding Zn-ribbon protein
MTDPDDEKVEGDWHRDQEIAALQRDLKNAQSTRAAAEEHLARLHAEVLRMTNEIVAKETQLIEAQAERSDAERAFKSAMVVIAYLASLL